MYNIYMNKKERLKQLLCKSIQRKNVIKVKYHYVLMNEEITDLMRSKRTTNKKLINRLKQIETEIERMEDEIRFILNCD